MVFSGSQLPDGTTLIPITRDSQIIVVAMKSNTGLEEVPLGSKPMRRSCLERVTERLRECDPDVIEGHNLFNFDLPLWPRAPSALDLACGGGADGSSVRIGAGTSRFKSRCADDAIHPVFNHGRHIIDTYQQIRCYDIRGHLSSYGLKQAVEDSRARIGVCAGPRLRRSGGTTGTACYVTRSTTSATSRRSGSDADISPTQLLPGHSSGRHRRSRGEADVTHAACLSHGWAQRPHRRVIAGIRRRSRSLLAFDRSL